MDGRIINTSDAVKTFFARMTPLQNSPFFGEFFRFLFYFNWNETNCQNKEIKYVNLNWQHETEPCHAKAYTIPKIYSTMGTGSEWATIHIKLKFLSLQQNPGGGCWLGRMRRSGYTVCNRIDCVVNIIGFCCLSSSGSPGAQHLHLKYINAECPGILWTGNSSSLYYSSEWLEIDRLFFKMVFCWWQLFIAVGRSPLTVIWVARTTSRQGHWTLMAF